MTLPTMREQLPTGQSCKGIDGMTGAGANQLCKLIRDYWAARGYDVEVRVIYDTAITAMNRTRAAGTVLSTNERMVIRSNMIAGLPRQAYDEILSRVNSKEARIAA